MEAKKVEALLALARDQLGIKESPPDSNRAREGCQMLSTRPGGHLSQ